MGYTDYMKQVNNGKVLIDFDYIPSKGFIDANLVRGIYNAKILSREQKKGQPAGSGDVVLVSATGGTKIITREELCKNYKHSSGKNIVISFLKTNTNYVVQGKATDKYKAIKLPDNCIGKVGNKSAQPGSYVICKVDSSGNLDKSTMTVISPKLFRKMFKVPMQPIIKNHMNGGCNKMLGLFNKNRNKAVASKPNIAPSLLSKKPSVNIEKSTNNVFDTSKLGLNPSNINIGVQPKVVENKYKFVATHRIVSMNNKKPLGFVIKEKASGKSKQMTTAQVSQLCEQKLVENLMVVVKENSGVKFLKGNGMRIESLPEVLG